MLKIFFFFLTFGLLTYDISQNGSFQKSQTHKYLKESGAIDYGQMAFVQAKKSLNKASDWAEENIPVYYNDTCKYVKPYMDLLYDLSLILKNYIAESFHSASVTVVKNYPHFQDSAQQMFLKTFKLARRSLGDFSDLVQNYTTSFIHYANNKLTS